MIKEFVNYTYYGDIVGRKVKQIEELYPVYCKLNNVEELDNIVNRICNEYELLVQKGELVE